MEESKQDAINRISKELFENAQKEVLTNSPMFIRLNAAAAMVAKSLNNGFEEKDIDWDKINGYLKENLDPYDFNVFNEFTSYEQLATAAMDSKTNCIIGPWRKDVCKECGKEFYISFKEVEFFRLKGLKVPKRCKNCRKNRRNNGK